MFLLSKIVRGRRLLKQLKKEDDEASVPLPRRRRSGTASATTSTINTMKQIGSNLFDIVPKQLQKHDDDDDVRCKR
jgi:hypothetical protein